MAFYQNCAECHINLFKLIIFTANVIKDNNKYKNSLSKNNSLIFI